MLNRWLDRIKRVIIWGLDLVLVIKDDPIPKDFRGIVFVLPESLNPDGTDLSIQSAANADIAVALFNNGKAEFVIISGGYSLMPDGIREYEAIHRYIHNRTSKMGARRKFHLDDEPVSVNTNGNAYWGYFKINSLRKVFGIKQVLVVCHRKQSRRAKNAFLRMIGGRGLDVEIYVKSTNPPYGSNSQGWRWRNEFNFSIWNLIGSLDWRK